MKTFIEWLKWRESTAFTRTRSDAAKGLKPPIAPASYNSHSTFSGVPGQKFGPGAKKKRKKKRKKAKS